MKFPNTLNHNKLRINYKLLRQSGTIYLSRKMIESAIFFKRY